MSQYQPGYENVWNEVVQYKGPGARNCRKVIFNQALSGSGNNAMRKGMKKLRKLKKTPKYNSIIGRVLSTFSFTTLTLR